MTLTYIALGVLALIGMGIAARKASKTSGLQPAQLTCKHEWSAGLTAMEEEVACCAHCNVTREAWESWCEKAPHWSFWVAALLIVGFFAIVLSSVWSSNLNLVVKTLVTVGAIGFGLHKLRNIRAAWWRRGAI